jgi:hypothetical protein
VSEEEIISPEMQKMLEDLEALAANPTMDQFNKNPKLRDMLTTMRSFENDSLRKNPKLESILGVMSPSLTKTTAEMLFNLINSYLAGRLGEKEFLNDLKVILE